MFFIYNPTVTFFILGLMASWVAIIRGGWLWQKEKMLDALLRWFVFFSIGISYLFNAVLHIVFADQVAALIGWSNSPFQYEVGFASLGFAAVGFIAFRGDWLSKVCAVVGPSLFWLGAAGGHVYQIVVRHDLALGNAGAVLYTDILLPVFGLGLLYLARPGQRRVATIQRG